MLKGLTANQRKQVAKARKQKEVANLQRIDVAFLAKAASQASAEDAVQRSPDSAGGATDEDSTDGNTAPQLPSDPEVHGQADRSDVSYDGADEIIEDTPQPEGTAMADVGMVTSAKRPTTESDLPPTAPPTTPYGLRSRSKPTVTVEVSLSETSASQ